MNDSILFSLPLDISTLMPLHISSISDIVNGIADKNITGFNVRYFLVWRHLFCF